MDRPKTKPYRSYLIRCWSSPNGQASRSSPRRFMVETISETPRRWGFDTFAGLIAFLEAELLADGEGAAAPEIDE